MTKQLSFFEALPSSSAKRLPLDPESERLLVVFGQARRAEGAHQRSATREASQLRSLARDAGSPRSPLPLLMLFADPARIVHILVEPVRPIARSTGRARLLAVQHFVRLIFPILGRDASVELHSLDALLPSVRSHGWHAAGTVVAGEPGRRRPCGPTLDGGDLLRIVHHAAEGVDATRRVRDRALVAAQCFSGLRAEEVVGLRWEDLEWTRTGSGFYGLTAAVERRGVLLRLLVPGPAAAAVRAFAEHLGEEMDCLSGPVFQARGRKGRHLSYRSARATLAAACRRAGYPLVEAVHLRAGFAAWLRAQGLSDHEVADVLGLARVRSVDDLLRRHSELMAQRTVRERMGR